MKLITALTLYILILFCNACESSSTPKTNNDNLKSLLYGKTMGTSYNIAIIHSSKLNIDNKSLQQKIDNLLLKLNQQVSTYIKKSQISQFNENKNTEWQTIDYDFFSILEAAQNISKVSNGSYDATISPLIELWGFGVKEQNKPPTKIQIDSVKSKVGYKFLELEPTKNAIKKIIPEMRIDLSSIAKGYAVDLISHFLTEQGLTNHLIEIGGELKANGLNQENKKWRIAVEQPNLSVSITQNGIEISNLAVATSGDYRNFFIEDGIRRSHIINPKTGYPIKHNLASVTVLHESATMADGYATAILVLGEIEGKRFIKENNIDALMVIRKNDKYKFWSNSELFN